MIDTVLFDWGDTLFHGAFDDAVLLRGWRAGLAAIGRDDLPTPEESAARFRSCYRPRIEEAGGDEVDYPALVRELLEEFGVELDDDELHRFLWAEHAMEATARRSSWLGHDLLDELRRLGLKLGLVSNASDPGWLLRWDLEWMGLARRLDVAVFSSEVGKRKPHPLIFQTALDALGSTAERALFVGDRRYEDLAGARRLGMTTVLARWFRDDPEDERGVHPDYEALAPADVLGVARGLLGVQPERPERRV